MFTTPSPSDPQVPFAQWPIRLLVSGLIVVALLGASLLLRQLWNPDVEGVRFALDGLWGPLLLLLSALLLLPVAWFQQSQQIRAERERRVMLGAARKRLAQADAVLDALADAVSIQTPDYRVLYQNARHREMVGQDATGSLCYLRYSRESRICEGCPVERVFATGAPQRLVKQRPAEHGGGFIEIHASPLRDSNGEIFAGIEVVRDISTMKTAEQQILQLNSDLQQKTTALEQANQDLQAFSYTLAHDIRSHLTPLMLAGDVLESECQDRLDDKGRQMTQVVVQSTRQLEQFVDGVLLLSRVVRDELSLAVVDLGALVREAILQQRSREPERRAEVEIAPLPPVRGDRALLQLAIDNLVENAWKYTATRSVTQIHFGSVERDGSRWFYLRDNGVGFDPQDAELLFVPFRRLHDKKDFPGTGIGLSTVARILRRHGGDICGEGEVDGGAVFYFFLPAAD